MWWAVSAALRAGERGPRRGGDGSPVWWRPFLPEKFFFFSPRAPDSPRLAQTHPDSTKLAQTRPDSPRPVISDCLEARIEKSILKLLVYLRAVAARRPRWKIIPQNYLYMCEKWLSEGQDRKSYPGIAGISTTTGCQEARIENRILELLVYLRYTSKMQQRNLGREIDAICAIYQQEKSDSL